MPKAAAKKEEKTESSLTEFVVSEETRRNFEKERDAAIRNRIGTLRNWREESLKCAKTF